MRPQSRRTRWDRQLGLPRVHPTQRCVAGQILRGCGCRCRCLRRENSASIKERIRVREFPVLLIQEGAMWDVVF